MDTRPMYPKLTSDNKFLGLEPMDFLALVAVYLLVFLISKNLFLNLALVLTAYLFLSLYKRKKSPRYTQALTRFLLLPTKYRILKEGAK